MTTFAFIVAVSGAVSVYVLLRAIVRTIKSSDGE